MEIFFDCFSIFGVMTNFDEYNSWDLNVLAFIFCMVFLIIVSKVDSKFQLSGSSFTL